MANFFDQFDAPEPQRGTVTVHPYSGGGNFFDQFDAPTPSDTTGFSEDLKKLTPQVGGARSAAIGATQGALLGFGDELAGLANASGLPVGTPPIVSYPVGAYRKLTGAPGAEDAYIAARDRFRADQAAAEAQHPYASGAGQVGGSLATAAIPIGLAGTGATLLGSAARGALGGAALGAAQGAGNAPELANVPTEAAIGAGIGGVIGATLPAAAGAVRRAISPVANAVSDRVARSAQTLQNEGVNALTAGQQTGNKFLKYFESEHGGRTVQDIYEKQQQQFTSAALRRIGVDSPIADPAVMQQAARDIGARFDDFAANNNIAGSSNTRRLIGDLLGDFYRYQRLGGEAPIVGNTPTRVANAIRDNGGTLPGEAYQAIRSDLLRSQRATSSPEVKSSLGDMIKSLDDAMERSAPADQVAAFRDARRQYANLIVLQKAVAQSGENITPHALRNAAKSGDIKRFVEGRTDLGVLANAGKEILRAPPESGTSSRQAARSAAKFASHIVPNLLFGAGGTYAGSSEGGPEGALVGGAIGLAAPSAGARIALSNLGRRYLTNQLAAGVPGAPTASLIQPLRALLQDQYGGQSQATPPRLQGR